MKNMPPESGETCVGFRLNQDRYFDQATGQIIGELRIGCHGITARFDGYGDSTTQDGYGSPIFIEHMDGKLMLYVWADINQEDPTHKIDLSGALESKRKPS